jgi:hypothetical protein
LKESKNTYPFSQFPSTGRTHHSRVPTYFLKQRNPQTKIIKRERERQREYRKKRRAGQPFLENKK